MGSIIEVVVVVVWEDGSRHKTKAWTDGATEHRSGKEELYAVSEIASRKLVLRKDFTRADRSAGAGFPAHTI